MVFVKGSPAPKTAFRKGFTPWNKGKPGYKIHSEEWKKELSKKFKGRVSPMKGRKHSKETIKKMSQSQKGKVCSEEAREKYRQSKLGNKNPMYGKTHSSSYKERLRIEMKGMGNHNWQGGKTAESDLRLSNITWEKRKREVYERDNYICLACGKKCRGTDRKYSKDTIQCHHKTPWRKTHNDSINNLVTLCLSCHAKTEATMRYLYNFYA